MTTRLEIPSSSSTGTQTNLGVNAGQLAAGVGTQRPMIVTSCWAKVLVLELGILNQPDVNSDQTLRDWPEAGIVPVELDFISPPAGNNLIAHLRVEAN